MQVFQATWKTDAAAAALAVAEKLKGRLEAHREKDKKDEEKWIASLAKMAEKVGLPCFCFLEAWQGQSEADQGLSGTFDQVFF